MFADVQTIVIKIGSAILVDGQTQALREDWLEALASDLAGLSDKRIILVSSGAIALGLSLIHI